MCQEHTFIEIVGKAGVIAGTAAAQVKHWRSDSRDLLGLVQLLDEETLVTTLLLTMTPQMLNSINKTYSIQGVIMLIKFTMTSCSLSWLITLL